MINNHIHIILIMLKELVFLDLMTLLHIARKSLYEFFIAIFIFYSNSRVKEKS